MFLILHREKPPYNYQQTAEKVKLSDLARSHNIAVEDFLSVKARPDLADLFAVLNRRRQTIDHRMSVFYPFELPLGITIVLSLLTLMSACFSSPSVTVTGVSTSESTAVLYSSKPEKP